MWSPPDFSEITQNAMALHKILLRNIYLVKFYALRIIIKDQVLKFNLYKTVKKIDNA